MGTSLNSYSAWRRGDVRESVEGSNLRYARPDLEVPAKYTFLPHQRVTTEGKAMACNCFSEVKERMEARIKESLGDSVHSMDECDFGSRVWVLEEGDYCQVMLPFNVRYRKRKKNGDPEQRLTNSDTKIAINYCPFCGTKFEGKAA
ncbi:MULTISPECIES: hypothetical protein [Citrobacter freundii complex]|nr:hypothetical protein [Citrobacter werkmanii]MBQ4935606.1 hypothetical protein [Citrobacter werkmanii]MBQ4948755.1 hypothetical protein [Citrobacter werkmanii]